MTRPDIPQPDDEQPAVPEHDSTAPAVEDDPTPDEPVPGEQQDTPDHDLAQDDDLRAGQYGPGR